MPPAIQHLARQAEELVQATNRYFLAQDAQSKNHALRYINIWLKDNELKQYTKDDKISATYLAHILKVHKPSIFARNIVQKSLKKWLQKDAAEILDFFKSTEDVQDLYDEFIKYRNKYYYKDKYYDKKPNTQDYDKKPNTQDYDKKPNTQDYDKKPNTQDYDKKLNPQEIRELNSKMNEALGCLVVAPINKNVLITKPEILLLIRNKRLDTIKEYLKDIEISDRINVNIKKDKVKDLFKDSVLAEHIQSYIEVTSKKNSPEVKDDIEDLDFNEDHPDDFDRTDETYKSFLKDITDIQSRYDNLNKQDARPIDKALWVLASTKQQRNKILDELKKYRVHKLKIALDVKEENNKFKIEVKTIDRIGSGSEYNHVIPVSVFLKSLKYSLNNQELNNVTELFGRLCSLYGRDYEKSIIFEFVKDKIGSTKISVADNLRYLLDDVIIPFIYFYWNTRTEATYKLAKTDEVFGKEGYQVKVFNENLEDIYNNFSQKSFRQFKTIITKIVQEYFQTLDLQNKAIDNERFNVIVGDVIEVLRIWLKLFEQSENKILLGHTQQDEYRTWKKKYLTKKEFGTKLIEAQKLGKVEEDKWKKDWEEYVLQHPDISVDERSSEGVSSLGRSVFNVEKMLLSPGGTDSIDTEQEDFYNKENIEKILSNGISDNLVDVDIVEYDDDLDEVQKTQCIEQLKQEQQTRLINQLKEDLLTLQSSQITEKFYVIGLKSDTQKIISASIIKIILANNILDIKIVPLIMHEYSRKFYDKISDDSNLRNSELDICNIRQCGSLIDKEELDISKFVEVARLRIQHIDSQVGIIQTEIDAILEMPTQSLEAKHKIIIEGDSSDWSVESGQDASRVSTGEQDGASGILKRKGTDIGSPGKKVKFNIENIEEHRDDIGLQASGSSCPTRFPSKKRLKRDLCQEKETEEIFSYEPLEENVPEASKISARLYSQIAYLVALEHPEPTNPNIKPDNVLTYMTNIGDIISEGEINHSLREQELLQTHYQEAQDFCNTYPKDTVLDLVGAEIDLSSRAWLFENGKHSLLVSYDGNRYHIHSPDLNYRQSFQTKEGVSFTDIELYAEAFFKWRSNSIEYDLFTLKSNFPESITSRIKQAKFWHPDQVVSDLVLLDKGSFSKIEEIPAKVVRELFFLDGKVPELMALHEDFFIKYSGRISIRMEELHGVLSSLDPQALKSLVNLVKQHNFQVDTAYINNMPESTKSLLHSYHNEISNKLKTSESITIKDLSDLSWSVLEKEMTKNPEISSELRELALQNVKELHSVAATRSHALGITSQTLFFLPDIIRSMNTGNFEGLQKTGEMMLGDMAFNKMYDSLISKLGSVLPESRIALLKKLPITSPIFKILTIYSIIELHKQLNNLAADSEEAGIIKHQLGEQYFTIGLMVAELFGLELGPLWIGLMAEQLVYGAIALRKQYHLDISFGEAFLMNLGFEQDKLKSILTERQLVDLNLSLVDRLSAQTNTSYGLVIIKVPKMSYDAPQVGNTMIEFKPQNSRFCMEDNVFLEKNSGYKRISSVISDEQNNNCVNTAALQISGDGLVALYGNNNSTEQQSIYVNFDPNEGDMKLHFTKEGLSRLDKLNNHQQNNTNATRPYVVTVQIYHKPYPDQIGLLGNTNYSLILNDDSKRIVSNYYIDGTSSFGLEDNSISTSIMFLNNKLFKGYNAYISGNTSDMQVRSIYSDDITSHIVLKNKDYLKLNLEHLIINGKLTIDIPNIEILYAKSATMLQHHHLRNNGIIEVRPNVLTFKILLEAPSIRQITINNKNAFDVIIDMEHLANPPFTISLHGIHTEYKSYYTFEVENLQLVLDEMTFTSRHFPKYFIFLCGIVKGWCKWDNNDLTKNILSIKGKINGKDEILTIEHSKATLGIFENENKCNKHIEIVNYNNVLVLENSLKFEKVLKHANYNISAYYHYINKNDLLGSWHTIEFFDTNSNCAILHHFMHDGNIQINEINYLIKENKIYALPQDNIDGNKLLRNYAEKLVPIFFNVSLSDSQISLEKNIIINNSTLYNIPDTTSLVFQKSNGEIFPISLRFLKDSFKYIKSDSGQEHLTSLMNQNQIRSINIENKIFIASNNNLEKLEVMSTTYDKEINENPYHIRNDGLIISQYGSNSSIHKVMLYNELGTQHINIIINTGCNIFSTNCFTSQYEFNCLNTPIAIEDNTNSTSIRFNQYNYIKTLSSQKLEVQCKDNIVSTIHLKTKQDLVLENLLIKDQLAVAANNVTILHAKSVNNVYITVDKTTKNFKMILAGDMHVNKLGASIISQLNIISTMRVDNDNIQLVYEYTEKYLIPIYTVKLEHINQNLFDSMNVSTNNQKDKNVDFKTPDGTLCNWVCFSDKPDYGNELMTVFNNDVIPVFKIQGKLYDNGTGSVLVEGNNYIFRIYNQEQELKLEVTKYITQPSQYYININKDVLLEGILFYFNTIHYQYGDLSINSIGNKLLSFVIPNNYRVLYHLEHQNLQSININDIDYKIITNNEICAICNIMLRFNNVFLLRYLDNDTVPICFDSTLQDANITKYQDGLLINNCFLDKRTEKTMINFQDSKDHSFQELLSSSTNPRLRRAIKEDKQHSEESASVTIDEQQININDELANSNTYNVARSSASILEPSFLFNNGLWNWVWNKLSNLSFKLLPEAEGATTDKSKSFNDIDKLIKQFNNHPSDTQIKESNDITPQYDYEIPSSRYKNSVPPSDNDQKLHCVPYSWDSNNQAYVTDAMTCVSPSGQAKIFSNVHQETNFIQTKGYSIQGDIYKNCRPVEFYGRDSVYCAGKHTNMLYTPVFQSKFFDNLNVQIMLFRIGVHLVKKALDYLKIKPKQEYIERHIETDKETIDLWTKSIEKVQILLNDLQDLANLNQEDLKFINNTNDDLCEIRQNIKNYIEKKMITTKEYEIINEKLEVLIEELDETKNRYFINVKEDCNQKISIEQLPHTSNDVQHNTVYSGYYISHNNSQEYYNNSYLLHDARPILTDLEVMNQNFGENNMIPPSLIGNTTEIVI